MKINGIQLPKLLIPLILGLSVLAGCSTSDEPNPNADANITAEEVARNPELLKGQAVTIRSNVVRAVDDTAFTLRDSRYQDDILVINVSGEPFVLPQNEDVDVQVTGEVQPFTLLEMQQNQGLSLEPSTYAEFETKPAILAKSIALAPDPGQVTSMPERFYDLAIAVEGEVEDVLDSNTLTLDEEKLFGASDLLVVGVPTTDALKGQRVTVTGKLRPLVIAEFEKDYDLTWDLELKDKLNAEYREKPVFIAQGIYPTAQ